MLDRDSEYSRQRAGTIKVKASAAMDAPIRLVSAALVRRISTRKRVFDVIGALVIGIATLPLMCIIAVAIRLSGSPVIFSHRRIGHGKRAFSCHKFRTMIPEAESILDDLLLSNPEAMAEWCKYHKLRDDPRVTPFGSFLRRSSLDELPQLWNVICGEMSLVGPRPVVREELRRYGKLATTYGLVRPGITGLWQVMGRSDITYSRRISMDMLYIRKQNIRMDLWILSRTLVIVLKRVGAH